MSYVLDSGEQTSWRTSATSVDFNLFLHQPTVVFKARANMPLGSVVYPLQFFLYDGVTVGAFGDLREDMVLLLGTTDGADDLGRVRLRRNANTGNIATSTIIYINRSSQGALDGEIDMQDNAYITVLNWYPLWSIPPLIDSNGIIYEDAESGFTDAKHLLPVANAGVDFLEVLATVGSTIAKSFGELVSYVTAPGATISSYLWTFPDGQTATTATTTKTFTANTVGYYSLAITDSLGNVKTSRRFMAVVALGHANLITNFEITQHVARVDGQELSFIPHQNILYSQYPDGIEALINMRERRGTTVGGLVGSPGFENMIFAGFIGQESMSGEAGQRGYLSETTITCLDMASKLRTLPGFTELKERESTPTSWAHMKGANIDRYVASILDHRSNALRRMDFQWSSTGDTYAFTVLGSDGGSLYEQADLRCQAIGYKLTCDRYGRLIMRPDPQLQAEADKTTDVIVPVAESDWSQLRRVWNRSPRTHWNWGESIAVSTANASAGGTIQTFWNVSPGLAPGQGLASQTSGEQLAASQDELNVRERHRYEARLNNFFGNIEVLLARDGYAIDPSLFKWVQLEITSTHAGVRGRSWVNTTRFLPNEMNYRYDHFRGTREQRVTLEKEVVTTRKAVTYTPPDNPGFSVPDSPLYDQPDLTVPAGFDYRFPPAGYARIAVLLHITTGSAKLGVTSTYDQASPTWTQNTLPLDGGEEVQDGIPNPHDPTRWECATSTKLRVYTNAIVSPIESSEPAFTYAVQTSTKRAIQHERNAGNENWIPVLYWRDSGSGGGLIYEGSTDNGATLQSPVLIGSAAVADLGIGGVLSQHHPALYVDPHTAGVAYTCAIEAASGNLRFYKTTNFGVSWAINSDYLMANWGCGASQGDPSAGLVIERPFQDTSFVWTELVDNCGAAQSSFIGKHTASTANIVPNASPPFTTELYCNAAIGGYEGSRLRRGLRTCDTDVNKLLVITNQTNAGTCSGNDIWLSLNGTTVNKVLPLANYETNTIWSGGVFGGGTTVPVYIWGFTHTAGTPGVPMGYVANADTWVDASNVQNKEGTGWPTTGTALNLGGW